MGEETHKWTFRPPCSLPSFARSFMPTDQLAGSDVSKTRIGEKWDKPGIYRGIAERRV